MRSDQMPRPWPPEEPPTDRELLERERDLREALRLDYEALRADRDRLAAEVDADNRNMQGAIDQIHELSQEKEAMQARIDALMLEYCPGEMTEAQRERWAECQRPVSAIDAAAIDAALSGTVKQGEGESHVHD
jgi:serine phosphatase RsbU (regulator of sigma subunit)